jgi:hypothetical protein
MGTRDSGLVFPSHRQLVAGAGTANDWPVKGIVDACLNHAPAADVDKASRNYAQILSGYHDPEAKYINTTYLAFCGPKDTAVRLIKSVIAGHYCAYTDLQNNAMLANLRGTPEFAELLSAAKQCRDGFLAERSLAAH